jgi:hypothetical protein
LRDLNDILLSTLENAHTFAKYVGRVLYIFIILKYILLSTVGNDHMFANSVVKVLLMPVNLELILLHILGSDHTCVVFVGRGSLDFVD